jgi:GNAT superfamily N-acetyltransferase
LTQRNRCACFDWRDEDGFRETVLPPPGDGVALVADGAGRLVGFMGVAGSAITGFFVADERRREGIASALLGAALRDPRCATHPAITVRSHNYWCFVPGVDKRYTGAIAFLESRGFARKGLNTDVSMGLEEAAALPRRRAGRSAPGSRVVPYEPVLLDAMRVFVQRIDMPGWIWPDWEARYARGGEGVRCVALRGDEIVGWVDGRVSPNGTGGINYIAVLEDVRRQGIGSVLLREAVAGLATRGAKSFFAPYVPAPFYLANGWRVCREYVIMQRQRTGEAR